MILLVAQACQLVRKSHTLDPLLEIYQWLILYLKQGRVTKEL